MSPALSLITALVASSLWIVNADGTRNRMLVDGGSTKEVAEELGRAQRTIRRWKDKARKDGKLP